MRVRSANWRGADMFVMGLEGGLKRCLSLILVAISSRFVEVPTRRK